MAVNKSASILLDEILEKSGAQPMTSGEVIRLSRKQFQMTLKEVESVTGIKESNLSAIENNRLAVSTHYAEIFAAAFDLHPSVILYPNGFEKKSELKSIERKMKKFVKRLKEGA